MKASFVYPNSRQALLAGIARGNEPDSQLHGALYLDEHGIDVDFHDPLLTRQALPRPFDRVAWSLRELTAPFELGATDVVFTPLANLLPLAARGRRLPVVVINFGLNLIWRRASGLRRRVLRESLRSAARIICLGDAQRDELVDAARLEPERVLSMVIPVDDRFFSPSVAAAGGLSVLTVGKDLARDYATFAEAMRPLDVEVTLVAHPRNLDGVALPANSALRGGVSFVGLRDLYAQASCVVLPQRGDEYPYGSEGGGLTALLEAMAMGKPVVATERAILRDYIDDGVDGILVPPEDPVALRDAVERVLGEPDLARSLGTAARKRVERAHTSRGFAVELAPVLRSVI